MEAPMIALYPCQTAIQGLPFQGVLPGVSSNSLPVRWSLLNAPSGMTINETNGLIAWPSPVLGGNSISSYFISLAASNQWGGDVAEYVLNVVTNDYPDLRVVSTRNIDFVVPGWMAAGFERWQPHHVVDLAYDRMRQLVGLDALSGTGPWVGNQIIKFNPTLGGSAGSGQPVNFGPFRASMDPVDWWDGVVGTPMHEMAHNFHALIGLPNGSWGWFGPFFHHGVEILQTPVMEKVVGLNAARGLTGEASSNCAAWLAGLRAGDSNSLAQYEAWIGANNQASDYTGDQFGAWIGICDSLMGTYGLAVLEDTERSFRYDGIPPALQSQADTPLKTMTLLFCTMSAAAGSDLREYFQNYGFDIDQAFYAQVSNQVFTAVANLPRDEDVPGGWKHCLINGHYYRLTGWQMTWAEAERTARRYGGHLVSVRSAAEDDWLVSRFSSISDLWIGLSDEAHEGVWRWVSGEPATYFNWGPGEPNGGRNENYGLLNARGTKKWNDASGGNRYRGLVEVTKIVSRAYEPEVTIVAMDQYIAKATNQSGQFRILCTTNGPAVIGVEVSGTAVEGLDYAPINHTITLPAGTNEAAIIIRPLAGPLPEGVEDILITITNSPWGVWPYRQAEMRLLQRSPTALTYNATAEFSLTNGNPNGVWSYGWMPLGFGQFHLLPNHGIWQGGVERPAWLGSGNSKPLIYKNMGDTFGWTPPGWLALITGSGTEPVVLRWTAPRSGPITVQGDFLPSVVISLLVGVRFNGSNWWNGVDSGGFLLQTNVGAGDTVDFTVYGGFITGTAPLSAVVSYNTPMLHFARVGLNTTVNFIAAGPGTYVLEFVDNLGPNSIWTGLCTNALSAGQFISFGDSRSAASGFYRVRVE
jgi:hypothetical protein